MGVLQNELDRLTAELCSDAALKVEFLKSILVKRGISLSEPQLQSLSKAIQDNDGADSVEIEGLPEDFVISDDEIAHAQLDVEDKLGNRVETAVNRIVEEVSPSVLQSLYAALPKQLRYQRGTQARFEKRLRRRWRDALDRLEMLIIIADEAGTSFADDMQREFAGQAPSDESVLLGTLVALHCRSCRTAREILCLLEAGYADGGHARWRSLHELAVTALFLEQHRGDAAQRYLDHTAVERWRAAERYQTYCHILGQAPFSAEELEELRTESNEAVAKYGASFRCDYGWAVHALAKKRPTFADIEANLDMSHWRPYFGLACQSVHACSQGLFFSLGLLEASDGMLLSGASDSGLADPGHSTAISLTLASVALLTAKPNLDALVTSKCMQLLCEDIGRTFLTVDAAVPNTDS
jgi:hypothetical protein